MLRTFIVTVDDMMFAVQKDVGDETVVHLEYKTPDVLERVIKAIETDKLTVEKLEELL